MMLNIFGIGPPGPAKATDDVEVEAALTLFPKKGEIRRAERPVCASHWEFAKPRETRFLVVDLVPVETRTEPSHEMRKKSEQESSEKVARTTVEV